MDYFTSNFLFALITIFLGIYAAIQAVRLYKTTHAKRLIYENMIKEKIQLLYMSKLAYGTFLIAVCCVLMNIHWVFTGEYTSRILELSDFAWNVLKGVTMAFMAQLCSMGVEFVKIRLEYTLLESQMRLIQGMISNSSGYVWQKDHCGRYEFCDPTFATLFFGLSSKESPVGYTDVELVTAYRAKTGKTHEFGELCADTDSHCRDIGERCRYLELGGIGDDFVIMDVVKTPIYDCGSYVGTVGSAWRINEDIEMITSNIGNWCRKKRIIMLSRGSYYIKDPGVVGSASYLKNQISPILKANGENTPVYETPAIIEDPEPKKC